MTSFLYSKLVVMKTFSERRVRKRKCDRKKRADTTTKRKTYLALHQNVALKK